MSDIEIFQVSGDTVTELKESSITIEKSLQNLIEKHLYIFFGVRFLGTECHTGKSHGGRIDTLGIDENGCPVIIEYKRALNQNVINQGLFYLDWLMDHKAEFVLRVQKSLGQDEAEKIEWSNPRLLCIAGDFTKYDEYAVQQIDRNIELIRYRRYGNDLLLFEQVNSVTAQPEREIPQSIEADDDNGKSLPDKLLAKDRNLTDLFESLKAYLLALGDDVQFKKLKVYFAFKRLKNFACVEVHPQIHTLRVYVKVDPESIELVQGFTRNATGVRHWGTGDLEISIGSDQDLERAKPLLAKSYEQS